MIKVKQSGDFSKTLGFLERCKEVFDKGLLDEYGRKGVEALSSATPIDTGLASSSWYYTIENNKGSTKLIWSNSDIEGGCNVAILIQYGHGTRNGGYVRGIDYINPAMRPIFDGMVEELMREVRK